jgi:hypothetical protein
MASSSGAVPITSGINKRATTGSSFTGSFQHYPSESGPAKYTTPESIIIKIRAIFCDAVSI